MNWKDTLAARADELVLQVNIAKRTRNSLIEKLAQLDSEIVKLDTELADIDRAQTAQYSYDELREAEDNARQKGYNEGQTQAAEAIRKASAERQRGFDEAYKAPPDFPGITKL
jgi:type VI protein secretion system component VasF